ncbi:MAG: glutamate synthase [Thaumarchaeota archaeon]|nr:glutamate synthase [Nitrososphaerota archaeon]
MKLDNIAFDRRFGQPVVKDGCGVFGILRKVDAPLISNSMAVNGISCIKYRGSDLGAGYAAFRTLNEPGSAPYKLQAFVTGEKVAEQITSLFEEQVGVVESQSLRIVDPRRRELSVWEATVRARGADADTRVENAVDSVNTSLFTDSFEGRIFSYGRYLAVYKEVGYPDEVAKMWGLEGDKGVADMWIAHTRQPTNSPGSLPIWSHPFASMNTAIVHNGDISSYGSNMELLNSWGIRSHVGTDSEVIAKLLDHLIRIEGLTIREAATVLTNPFERNISQEMRSLLYRYRGARLDGPFAVVAGYADGKDTYLIALTDRSKFRPLLFGEDENYYYVASEENQIRNQSRRAKIWTPEPGAFFIASLRDGLMETGTERSLDTQNAALGNGPRLPELPGFVRIDATGKEFKEINEAISSAYSGRAPGVVVENCTGQRYLGIGVSTRSDGRSEPFRIVVTGFPGNCLANLNDGASFEVHGNAADDLADTMHAGSIAIHGNCRDVAGQAIQGGTIFVRGTVGNRAAIQMREYTKERPFLIVGETADDYLGEYMAGGVVMVLNLSDSKKPARNYIGTGMVGGRIYIRGRVKEEQVGLIPQREDVLRYLRAQTLDGSLSKETYDLISRADYPSLQLLSKTLPDPIMIRILTIFFATKYTKPLVVESRKLDEQDLAVVGERLRQFFKTFSLPHETLESVLASEFTVIKTKDEKVELHVPPQEAPIEE